MTPACQSVGCEFLPCWLRLISSKICWCQTQTFTHFKHSPSKIFSHFQPACFSYPRKLLPTSAAIDKIAQGIKPQPLLFFRAFWPRDPNLLSYPTQIPLFLGSSHALLSSWVTARRNSLWINSGLEEIPLANLSLKCPLRFVCATATSWSYLFPLISPQVPRIL